MVDKTIVTVAGENGLADIEFAASDSLYNNIWLSLMVRKGSRFNDPDFGSRLHELKSRGGKITSSTLIDATMYAEQALLWMKKTGRVSSIEVSCNQNADVQNRIDINITIIRSNNRPITYTVWYDVI